MLLEKKHTHLTEFYTSLFRLKYFDKISSPSLRIGYHRPAYGPNFSFSTFLFSMSYYDCSFFEKKVLAPTTTGLIFV